MLIGYKKKKIALEYFFFGSTQLFYAGRQNLSTGQKLEKIKSV